MARSLRIEDFSDTEFLLAVEDSIGDNGYATVHMIQASLQLDHDFATNCIGSRLGYLRTIGIVSYMDVKSASAPKAWFITRLGKDLMHARFEIGAMTPSTVVAAMRSVNSHVSNMGYAYHTMLRREFRYGDAQRRRRFR